MASLTDWFRFPQTTVIILLRHVTMLVTLMVLPTTSSQWLLLAAQELVLLVIQWRVLVRKHVYLRSCIVTTHSVTTIASTSSLLTININPAAVTANLTCTFLDGQPYFCLVCCGSDLLSYPIKTLTNRGVVVGGTIYGLMANHVYYCKGSAYVITNGTSCDGSDVTHASVAFSFKTQGSNSLFYFN